MRSVVITGASTGIGYSASEILVKSGYHVFGSVRNKEDEKKLKKLFGEQFTALLFDVRDEKAISDSVRVVEEKLGSNGKLIALVNNAGIALGGPSIELPVSVFEKQFEVNLMGVVRVTNAYANLLGAYRLL